MSGGSGNAIEVDEGRGLLFLLGVMLRYKGLELMINVESERGLKIRLETSVEGGKDILQAVETVNNEGR